MSEEEYEEFLQRVEENQRRLMSHADKKDDFAKVEKRLAELLERAKKRMIRNPGGQ